MSLHTSKYWYRVDRKRAIPPYVHQYTRSSVWIAAPSLLVHTNIRRYRLTIGQGNTTKKCIFISLSMAHVPCMYQKLLFHLFAPPSPLSTTKWQHVCNLEGLFDTWPSCESFYVFSITWTVAGLGEHRWFLRFRDVPSWKFEFLRDPPARIKSKRRVWHLIHAYVRKYFVSLTNWLGASAAASTGAKAHRKVLQVCYFRMTGTGS